MGFQSFKVRGTKAKSNDGANPDSKFRRLSSLDVSDFLKEKNIASSTELFAVANAQRESGKKDLAAFLLSRTPKQVEDLIGTTWKMVEARSVIEREKMNRMELLEKAIEGDCAAKCKCKVASVCNGSFIKNNHIHPYVYAASLRELLEKGRGKFRKIIIKGPANCAKSFMLKPLQGIYNPANDKYAWVGAESAEAIFLNYFRWSSELITWQNFLLLLEGKAVHLPSPKNHFAKDVCITTDVPIFATGKSEVTYIGKYNQTDDRETEMMAARWKVFKFSHQFKEKDQKDIPPCCKCFAKLAVLGKDAIS
ncbi:uncharacterized protein LOC135687470 [Rhopilema esculentum]|uniref:uncharacterized protein LOC135687470 n=1 Tax=Rhopilema esculentum TaxID=499914 RepID=UPI0031D01371